MRSRGLVPNRGGGRSSRRDSLGRTTYVLEGPLRFVDRGAARAALLVEGGNACGRRFVGETVTLDLRDARMTVGDRNMDGAISAADLLAGERVIVSVRLTRELAALPALLRVRRLTACEPLAGT